MTTATPAAPEGDAARPGAPGAPGNPPPAAASSRPQLFSLLRDLLHDLPGLIGDRVQLLALELKRARQALIGILMMLVLTAILALTAWISFWVLVVAAAMRYGLPWDGACIVVLVVNAFGAWLAVRHAGKLAGYLALPATVRQLTRTSPAAPQTSPAEGSGGKLPWAK